ncbi:hypothetical protein QH494_01640 [Sphingomonas sp. AR_OL41]|uniref:hypothetical protein n=1 Tax=Sphingomonas sp. AR_OL41 TaxID=3042729 RepID=UPI00247FA846|nr:hypothetical protein [Sphingomonas sp. AR_OL41]MDH7970869.1 hypothetical protein [Sphingomonas sp. AR_OL41]
MGMLDGLLGQIASNVDVAGLAAKVGISPEQAASAITALGQAHTAPGNTVDTAAVATGLPTDILQQIVGHIGGEGALGQFASMLVAQGGGAGGIMGTLGGLLDQNGDGSATDEIAGFAKGLFGKS